MNILMVLRRPVVNKQKRLVELLHPIFLHNILSWNCFSVCFAHHEYVSTLFGNSGLAQTPHFVHGKLEVERREDFQSQDMSPGGLTLNPLLARCLSVRQHVPETVLNGPGFILIAHLPMDRITEICDQDDVSWNEWIYKPGDQPCGLLIRSNLHVEHQYDRPSEGFVQLV